MKIRQNGKYYQIGYYDKGKWINIKHIGTAKEVLKMVREASGELDDTYQEQIHTNTFKVKN